MFSSFLSITNLLVVTENMDFLFEFIPLLRGESTKTNPIEDFDVTLDLPSSKHLDFDVSLDLSSSKHLDFDVLLDLSSGKPSVL